jgi:ribose 5-phosphate isomerase RpiB
MLVAIASDKTGSPLYESICAELHRQGQVILDFGISPQSLDDFSADCASRVAWSVDRGDADCGIICSAATGACCSAAKSFGGVRAIAYDHSCGSMHEAPNFDTCNVLCLPAHDINTEQALELIRSFLKAAAAATLVKKIIHSSESRCPSHAHAHGWAHGLLS